MARAAQDMSHKRGIWKVGERHVEDMGRAPLTETISEEDREWHLEPAGVFDSMMDTYVPEEKEE